MRRPTYSAAALVATLLAAFLTVLAGRPAAALAAADLTSPTPVVSNLSVQGGTAMLTVSVTLPPGDQLEADRTSVTMGGQPLESAVTNQSTTSGHPRIAVLVVDTSGSMGTGGIAAARQAANAYLAAVAPDVRVGLVSFADSPHTLATPTTDRSVVRTALGLLKAKGETSLYDAVGLATRMAGQGGAVVVLSDGADTVSNADLDGTLAGVRESGARVSTVAFRTADGVRGPLARIAAAGSGQIVAAADASHLAAAFAAAAAGLPAQLQLRVDLPSNIPAGATLSVDVSSARSHWVVEAALPASAVSAATSPTTTRPTASLVTPLPWYRSLVLTLGLVFLALLLFGWLLLPRGRSAVEQRQRLLEVYSVTGRRVRGKAAIDGDADPPSAVLGVSQRIVDRGDLAARLTTQLEMAGSRLRPAEWVVVRVSVMIGLAAAVSLVSRHVLVGAAAGVVVGWLGTHAWLSFRQTRRVRAFNEALPDTLQLVASSLRTGFSLPQALDAAQQDGVEPMAAELGRALAAARIGVPLEDELERIADRTRSVDWLWAVMAIRIQRSVGGNLAEVLTTTVRTLRERAATRRLVRSLSAEGRLSAYILIALPILVFSFLLLIRRTYLRPLWTSTAGVVMVVGAAVLMLVGALWMRNVVTVEE